MFRRDRCSFASDPRCRQASIALALCLLFNAVAAAQDSTPAIAGAGLSMPAPIALPLVSPIPVIAGPTEIDVAPPVGNPSLTRSGSAFFQIPGGVPGVRRITLAQAQQLATPASSTLTQLAELQVEAARQHRLGVKSLYFPNVGTQFGALEL